MTSQPGAPGGSPRTLKGHSGSVMAVAFAPDGTTLASGSRDGTVKLRDVKAGTLQRTLEAHPEDVYAVAFSPDGKRLATGGGDRTIRLWDLRTARVLRTLEGHGDIVRSVAFAPDQQTLASAGVDNPTMTGVSKPWHGCPYTMSRPRFFGRGRPERRRFRQSPVASFSP